MVEPSKEVLLQRFEYGVQVVLSRRMLRGVEVDIAVDRITEIMGYVVAGTFRVPGERLAEYRYPRDWWQAVKARFAPHWALARWPVAETVVEARALYPMLSIPDTGDAWGTIRFEELR